MRALRSGEAPQVLWKLVRGIDVRRAERPAASVDLIGGFSLGCVEQPVTAVEGEKFPTIRDLRTRIAAKLAIRTG